MKYIKNKELWWLSFALLSLALFGGYFLSYLSHNEDIVYEGAYLKGLSVLQHFAIHYAVGITAGMLILVLYRVWTKKTLNEPLVLAITTLISHFPDIRFAFRGMPHDSWEVFFLFHTVADESFAVFWVGLFMSILLVAYYRKLIKNHDF